MTRNQAFIYNSSKAKNIYLFPIKVLEKGNCTETIHLIDQVLADGFHNSRLFLIKGIFLQKMGRYQEAMTALGEALVMDPDCTESLSRYKMVIEQMPDAFLAYNDLAIALSQWGKNQQAQICFETAIRLKPDYAEAYNNLGRLLKTQGYVQQAIEQYQQALEIKPDYANAHWNLALALLLSGQLEEGWNHFSWRSKANLPAILESQRQHPTTWQGESFAGKRLLIRYEQGIGDCIHMVRYLPMVKNLGGTVILEAPRVLMPLLQCIKGLDEITEAADDGQTTIKFDLQIHIMDLPGIFNTTLNNIPDEIPYIYVDQNKVSQHNHCLTKGTLKVGIVWAGSPKHTNDHNRSCDVRYFRTLTSIPGVELYSLQEGPARQQLSDHRITWIVDLADEFVDFTATAAVIENLDLVISVDTAVLHLAGAMGKPVWALLPFIADWRWLLERGDSPWYPSMRLFRQHIPKNWDSVLEQVKNQLHNLVIQTQHGRSISYNRHQAEIHSHQADILQAQGNYSDAVVYYKQALEQAPDYTDAYNNLGVVLMELGHYHEAVIKCTQAVQAKPQRADYYNNLACALQHDRQLDEAQRNCTKALQLKPDWPEAHYNLASILREKGCLTEAIANMQRALQLKPDFVQARYHLCHMLLQDGRFTEAWQAYDWWCCDLSPSVNVSALQKSPWDGSSFAGKRLFVLWERGIGDNIQFLRYLPLVKVQGGTIILETPESMLNLLRTCTYLDIDQLVPLTADHRPQVECDLYTSLLDLPKILDTSLETIPAHIPYISADPQKITQWGKRITGPELKIGIVWSGDPHNGNNDNRSCTLKHFAPLVKIPGIQLYSLQMGETAHHLETFEETDRIINVAPDIKDFVDTAAAIMNLDVIISVDTAVLHLAGALGKPAWGLIAFAPDWRWMLQREDSPWYPSMRLLRQPAPGHWEQVFSRILEQLTHLADIHNKEHSHIG